MLTIDAIASCLRLEPLSQGRPVGSGPLDSDIAMPEGPEIRRVADRLGRVLAGRALAGCELHHAALAGRAAELECVSVLTVTARAKALLIGFDNGLTLYSHNQLYGRWYVMPRGRWPSTGRSLRVALHTDSHSALLYSASDIELLDDAGLAAHPFLARLGPDVLDAVLDEHQVAARLLLPAFRRRSLAALYLDQSFLAGVGNYLRSEILFFAGVDPAARPERLDDDALARLAKQSLAICRRAYRTGGITNPPSRVAALKADGATRSRFRFAVFGRDGLPCYDCGGVIERRDAASRRLYSCPNCQRSAA